jgi:hypothetical protein
MLISGREAARILLVRGGMAGEAQARAILRSGAAGPGIVTGPGVLFEQDLVHALADRPWLDRTAQEATNRFGVYIARLSRTLTVDLTRPWPEIAAQVDRVPPMPVMTRALLELTVRVSTRLSWVATPHGNTPARRSRRSRFRLEPPGGWFESWREHRLDTPRGGRPWLIRRARAS